MNKPSVSTITLAAEVVASVAVVISLVFVVKSLDQNTAAIRSSNDNMIWQINDSQLRDVISDPEFAQLLTKYWSGAELNSVESLRMDYFRYREIQVWEIAFSRHSEGLMTLEQWKNWDKSCRSELVPFIPQDKWAELMSVGWGDDFVQHANAVYAEHWELSEAK